MDLRLKNKKKPWNGKITFRCFKEQEEEVKGLSDVFDFAEWFRDSLTEGLKQAKGKRKNAS